MTPISPTHVGQINKRNGVIAGQCHQHILNTHPDINSDENPPDHTLMIEASFKSSKKEEASSTDEGRKGENPKNAKE